MENNKINNDELTLRDQFAMAAIQGAALLMYDRKMVMTEHARNAYVIADAMMEARK